MVIYSANLNYPLETYFMNLTNFYITLSATLRNRNSVSFQSSFNPPSGLLSVIITNNLNPFIMKTNILKALSLILLITCFGKVNAQSDLLAMNTVSSISNMSDFINRDEKVTVSNFKKIIATEDNSSVVTVKCQAPVTMQVRVFNLNGDLAKEESHKLNNGLNDLNVNLNDLSQGVYMVQFYTTEGSAVRRFVKNN